MALRPRSAAALEQANGSRDSAHRPSSSGGVTKLASIYLDARNRPMGGAPPQDSRAVNLLDDLLGLHQRQYGSGASVGAAQTQRQKQREQGWSDHTNTMDRHIPTYDALHDPHCLYTRSRQFHASPYMQLMRQMQREHLAIGTESSGSSSQRGPQSLPPLQASATLPAESDPSQQLTEVLAVVTRREALLERLPLLAPSLPQSQVAVAAAELRELTLRAVEAVLKWRRAVSLLGSVRSGSAVQGLAKGVSTVPPPFVWKGENYLLKLLSDTRPILNSREVMAVLPVGSPVERNPLLLMTGLDEMVASAIEGAPLPTHEESQLAWGSGDLNRLELVRARRVALTIAKEEQLYSTSPTPSGLLDGAGSAGSAADQAGGGGCGGGARRGAGRGANRRAAGRRGGGCHSRSGFDNGAGGDDDDRGECTRGFRQWGRFRTMRRHSVAHRPGADGSCASARWHVGCVCRAGDTPNSDEMDDGAMEDITAGERTRHLQLASSEAMRLTPPQLTVEELNELGKLTNPPLAIIVALVCLQLLLEPHSIRELPPIAKLRTRQLRRSLLRRPKQTIKGLQAFDPAAPLPHRVLEMLWPILTSSRFGVPEVRRHSRVVGDIYVWVQKVVVYHMKLGAPPRTSASSVGADAIGSLPYSLLTAKQDDNGGESSSSDIEPSSSSDTGRTRSRANTASFGGSPSHGLGRSRPTDDERSGAGAGPVSDTGLDASSPAASPVVARGASFKGSTTPVSAENSAHMSRALKELRKELAVLKSELQVHTLRAQGAQDSGASIPTAGGAFGAGPAAASALASRAGSAQPGEMGVGGMVDAGGASMGASTGRSSSGAGIVMAPVLIYSAPWRVGGEELFDVRIYTECNDNEYEGEAFMRIESFERDTGTDWPPIRVLPFVVHRLTGLSPVELERLPSSDRAASLQPLLSSLRTFRSGFGADNGEYMETLTIESDTLLHRGQHTISKFRMDVTVDRLEGDGAAGFGSPDADPVGLRISARQVGSIEVIDTLELCVTEAEIKVLLINQPGLFERARCKWAARASVAQWLVARLSYERKSRLLGVHADRIDLDRSILLPLTLAEHHLLNGQHCRLDVQQRGEAVVLRAFALSPSGVGVVDAQGGNSGASVGKAARSEPPSASSTLTVTWAEMQAFSGAKPLDSDPSVSEVAAVSSSSSLLSALVARVSINPVVPEARPAMPDSPDAPPKILNPTFSLRLDRALYHEVRTISSVNVVLRASAQGREILFHAVRVSDPCVVDSAELSAMRAQRTTGEPPFKHVLHREADVLTLTNRSAAEKTEDDDPLRASGEAAGAAAEPESKGDGEGQPLALGREPAPAVEEYMKVITQDMMVSLIAGEPRARHEGLLASSSRAALCRVLAGRLKLVWADGGRSLETSLFKEHHHINVSVNGTNRHQVIGTVDITDTTTLRDARRMLETELDEGDVPEHYRIEFQSAPCSKHQETFRMAIDCLPCLVLLTKVSDAWGGGERAWRARARGGGGATWFCGRVMLSSLAVARRLRHSTVLTRATLSCTLPRSQGDYHASGWGGGRRPTSRSSRSSFSRGGSRGGMRGPRGHSPGGGGRGSILKGAGSARASSPTGSIGRRSVRIKGGGADDTSEGESKDGDGDGEDGGKGDGNKKKKKKRRGAFSTGRKSMVKGARGRGPGMRRKGEDGKPGTAEDASPSPPPVSVPMPEQRPKTPIPMVAIPIQTTVTATQGWDKITLEDVLDDLDLEPDDTLRIGNYEGADWKISHSEVIGDVFAGKMISLATMYDHTTAMNKPEPDAMAHHAQQNQVVASSPTAGEGADASASPTGAGAAGAAGAAGGSSKQLVASSPKSAAGSPTRPSGKLSAVARMTIMANRMGSSRTQEVAEEEEDEEVHEEGEKFERLNLWKLIPKPKDTRPRWRVEYDNGTVPFGKDFQVRTRRRADSLPCPRCLTKERRTDGGRRFELRAERSRSRLRLAHTRNG